jgi:hypothetical protein
MSFRPQHPNMVTMIEWIKCSTLLPPDEREVLVARANNGDPFVTTGQYRKNGDVWEVDGEYPGDVTLWAEWPEAPKE